MMVRDFPNRIFLKKKYTVYELQKLLLDNTL